MSDCTILQLLIIRREIWTSGSTRSGNMILRDRRERRGHRLEAAVGGTGFLRRYTYGGGWLLDPESEQRNRPEETSASVQSAGLEREGGGRSETEEADAYAAAQRRDIMTNVGVVFDLSERAEQETYALLDLDGDGTAEKLLLRSRMAQVVTKWIIRRWINIYLR